jgi:hypothetical protein
MIAAGMRAADTNCIDPPPRPIKSPPPRDDETGVSDDVAVSLDFDHDLPLGDVTLLGQPMRDPTRYDPAVVGGAYGLPRWEEADWWEGFTASASPPAPAVGDAGG